MICNCIITCRINFYNDYKYIFGRREWRISQEKLFMESAQNVGLKVNSRSLQIIRERRNLNAIFVFRSLEWMTFEFWKRSYDYLYISWIMNNTENKVWSIMDINKHLYMSNSILQNNQMVLILFLINISK